MTYRERIKGSDQTLGEYARLLDGYEIAVEQQQKLLIDATQSLVYLRTMRDPRAAIYETIVGLLRAEINRMGAE